MPLRSKILATLAALSLALPLGASLHAKAEEPAAAVVRVSYSDAELRSFAGAMLDIRRVVNDYRPQLQAASGTPEEERVMERATSDVQKAIAARGMDIDKFNEILVAAQVDSDVADKVKQHLVNGMR